MNQKKNAEETNEGSKIVTFSSLKGLKIAQGKKKLPRGLKVKFGNSGDDVTGYNVEFMIPKQDEPVLTVGLKEFAETALRSSGFKLDVDAD